MENIMENIFAALNSTTPFKHVCDKCGQVKCFNKAYPDRIEIEVDDEESKPVTKSVETSKVARPLCPVCNTNKRVSEVNNEHRYYSESVQDIKVSHQYKCAKCNGHFFCT